ncbi:RIMS-binding protein 3A-like [Grus japonensis]|uniref:RIMS-binding protein 3A-like n=1 Tax=Grus japonensis TaxID=30415 RepID=A0ABC9W9W2_GRUJA
MTSADCWQQRLVADGPLPMPSATDGASWQHLQLAAGADAHLQHALQDLERQCSALELENHLLRKSSSPEACKEAERLQQKNAQLAGLTEQLKERCRHLQETIEHLMNTLVPLPIQSSAKEQCMKIFPQQRAGERREPAGALLAQAQQNEVSHKVAEELQAQLAADDEGSYCGDCRGGFCEKIPEASTMSNKVSVSRLQDRPTTGQGQAHHRRWLHFWDNTDRKRKKTTKSNCRERGVRGVRNNSTDIKVSEKGRGGGARGTEAEIPLQPMEKTMVKQAVPLQPMEDDGGADIHLQPVEDPMLEQVDARRRL